MATINPYLSFNGNCEEAFNFYKSVFGTEWCGDIMRYKDMPPSPEFPMPKEMENKIMHIALKIGKHNDLMGADMCEGFGPTPVAGSNFSICITADTEAEAKRLFSELSAGGQVTMPLEKQFWGALFGCCTDKFGIGWMVSFYEKQ